MDNKQDLIRQLEQNKTALLQLMNSADGRRLIQLMQQQSGLQQAAGAAAKGDASQLTQMVSRLMETREGAQLVERINRTMEGRK